MAANKNKFGNTGNLVHALGSFEKSMKPLFGDLSKSIETLNDNISNLGSKIERPISPRSTNGQSGSNGIKDSINDLNASIEKLTEVIEKGGKGGSGSGLPREMITEEGKTIRLRGSGHYNYDLERLKRGEIGKDPLGTISRAALNELKNSLQTKWLSGKTASKGAVGTASVRGATTTSAKGVASVKGATAGGEAVTGGATAGRAAAGGGAMAALGGPAVIITALIEIIEFGIGKATEYMTLNYENQMRALQAITTATTNSMQANLALWQNSLNGAYEAQNLAMSSTLAMVEAMNATELANRKLTDSWFSQIPILGQILSYREKEMEMQNRMEEQRLKAAEEVITKAEGYAKQIDSYLEKQDQAIHDYTRSVGLSVDQTRSFETRMIALNKSLAAVGKTAEDVLKIQASVQEQSGRIINYSNEDYKNIGAIGRVMGDSTVAKFLSETVIFNQSVESSAAVMTDMYNYANRMGLSQKKLTQSVLNNLKTANKYQFKGGIKGFIDFNKWAENVRFNVAQLGNMIEKIQTGGLEGIIKQAAQVQVLGGNFAMHADPLRMAYNAFMDPEELAKDFYDSLKAEGVFDTKTGELYQGAGNMMRVRAYSEAMGYSFEDAKTMLRERTKRENIGKQLQNSGLAEEQIQAVANGAQRDENGNWYVNTLGGNRVNVSDIGQNFDIGSILSNNQDEKMAQYAEKTLSATERIAATTQYISALLGGASLDKWIQTVDDTNDVTVKGYEKNQESMTKAIATVYEHNVKAAEDQIKEMGSLQFQLSQAYVTQDAAKEAIDRIRGIMEEQWGHAEEIRDIDAETMDTYDKLSDQYENTSWKNPIDKLTLGFKKEITPLKGDFEKMKKNWQNGDRMDAIGDFFKMDGRSLAKGALNFTGTGWAIGLSESIAQGVNKLFGGDTFLKGWQPYSWIDNAINGGIRTNAEKMNIDRWKKKQESAPQADDATISSGSSVIIPSSKVTPINDGATEFAKTNPQDSAIFAKTGGPFDKLFDDIFGRIDAVYNTIAPRGRGIGAQMQAVHEEQSIRALESRMANNPITNIMGGNNNTSIDFKPIRLEINGRLDIAGGGANMNIMQELKKDPFFIRSLTQLISNSLSEKVNGGKALYNGGNLTYL